MAADRLIRPGGRNLSTNGVMVDSDFYKDKDIWEKFENSNEVGAVEGDGGMRRLGRGC